MVVWFRVVWPLLFSWDGCHGLCLFRRVASDLAWCLRLFFLSMRCISHNLFCKQVHYFRILDFSGCGTVPFWLSNFARDSNICSLIWEDSFSTVRLFYRERNALTICFTVCEIPLDYDRCTTFGQLYDQGLFGMHETFLVSVFSCEIELFSIKFLYNSCEFPVCLWVMIRFAKYSNLYLVFLFTWFWILTITFLLVENFDS